MFKMSFFFLAHPVHTFNIHTNSDGTTYKVSYNNVRYYLYYIRCVGLHFLFIILHVIRSNTLNVFFKGPTTISSSSITLNIKCYCMMLKCSIVYYFLCRSKASLEIPCLSFKTYT